VEKAMRLLICAFFLSSTIVFAQSQALNQETFDLQNNYQKHFPRDIYEYLINNELIDIRCAKNSKENQSSKDPARINITIETMDDKHYVLIDYQREKITDNFRGMLVAYQNGKVISYVIFDEEGRDYVASPPIFK
jgi:hypothetical protein